MRAAMDQANWQYIVDNSAWITFGGQANNATTADSTETPARQLPGTEETNPVDLVTPEGSPVVPRRLAL